MFARFRNKSHTTTPVPRAISTSIRFPTILHSTYPRVRFLSNPNFSSPRVPSFDTSESNFHPTKTTL